MNVCRVGDHTLDLQLEHMRKIAFPGAHVGLGAGDGHRLAVNRHSQNLVALGKGVGHQWRDGCHVDFQRVDAHVGLATGFGQPSGQGFQVQLLARPLQVVKLKRSEKFERMQLDVHRTATLCECRFCVVLAEIAFGNQISQHIIQVKPAIL